MRFCCHQSDILLGMKYATILLMGASVFFAQTPQTPNPDSHYQLGPDSLPQEGVPKGEIRGPVHAAEQGLSGYQPHLLGVCSGAIRSGAPASLMIFNDGQAFMDAEGDARAQNVMDNLIYRREIPVMIGVFINPGRRPDQPEPNAKEWGDRTTNRPTEYNSLDDKYARVIVDELMPVLYKAVQHFEGRRSARHWRRELGRDRGVHGGLGAAPSVQQGAEHCGQLRGSARRKRVSGHRP